MMLDEQEYLEALNGIHNWVCAKGHCHWDADYMLTNNGQPIECPVKMVLDSVEFYEYLGQGTIPDNNGRCPYFIEGLDYAGGGDGEDTQVI